MTNRRLTRAQANLELALLQANAELTSSSDIYIRLTDLGLPSEVAVRLKSILEFVKPIAGRVVSIGKIIALKLIEFVEQHPNMAIGIAVGAAVSAIVGAIPLLGPLLMPLAMSVGMVVGAVAGHRIDKADGRNIRDGLNPIEIGQDLIEIARAFMALLIETLVAIGAEFS